MHTESQQHSGLWEICSRLEEWQASVRATARKAVFAAMPRLGSAALDIAASGMRFRVIPRFFARDLVRISPALNDDLLELYGRSEQVLANRFGFFGKTEQFASEIEWERAPSAAWRAELHSFDYALDLALTYRISGDERYARHLRYLVAHWISSNPPGQDTGWAVCPLARRIRNWILAADLAREDWERDAVFLELVTRSLALEATYLTWLLGPGRTGHEALLASRALLLASRFFVGERSADFNALSRSLLAGVLDGPSSAVYARGHAPPAWQYELCMALTEHLLIAQEDDARCGQWALTQLSRALDTLEGMLLPDGTLPLFGREGWPSADALSDLFAMSAALLADTRSRSLAGTFGILPYMLLGESGQARFERLPACPWRADSRLQSSSGIYRLGDGKSSALLINGVHGSSADDHNDWLSYELVINGQRTVVDSGAFSAPGDPSEENFASARAHNTLVIDGQEPRPVVSDPHLAQVLEGSQNAKGLWLSNGEFKNLGISHDRAFLLIEGRYWVVLDRLSGQGSHRVESVLHFYPTFEIDVKRDRTVARSGAASVTVLILSIGQAGLTVAAGGIGKSAGWYSPAIGAKYPSAVLVLEWPDAPLPWVGGYVLSPGVDDDLHALGEVSASAVTIALAGKQHTIPLRMMDAE